MVEVKTESIRVPGITVVSVKGIGGGSETPRGDGEREDLWSGEEKIPGRTQVSQEKSRDRVTDRLGQSPDRHRPEDGREGSGGDVGW